MPSTGRMQDRRARWTIWLAVGIPTAAACAAIAAALLGAPSGAAWDVAWTASSIGALAGTAAARRYADASVRSRWTWWTAATACWLIGQLAWDLFGVIGAPDSPNLADIGWWAFAIVATVGVAHARQRSRRLRLVAWVEALPL